MAPRGNLALVPILSELRRGFFGGKRQKGGDEICTGENVIE